MGSNPTLPEITPELAQFGRASALGAEGRMFESCIPDQYNRLLMNKDQAQKIYNEVEKAISQVRNSAHQEQFILNSKEFDNIYLQVLNLLEEKRRRTKNLIDNN